MILATGCSDVISLNPYVKPAVNPERETEVEVVIPGEISAESTPSPADGKISEGEFNKLPVVSEEDIDWASDHSRGLYYYEILSPEEKKCYNEIFYVYENMLENVVVSFNDEGLLDRISSLVLYDHPELFYLKGYKYIRYTDDSGFNKISLSGDYVMDRGAKDNYLSFIDAYRSRFISDFNATYPEGTDDYGKIKYTYEYIINNTEYDRSSEFNQNMLSVMIDHKSVCRGYAAANQYLLRSLGIECTMVEGVVEENEPHAWNLVKADGEYYYVDVTWGDSSFKLPDKEAEDFKLPISYEFLLVPYNEIKKTHKIKSPELMPDCVSYADNYYIKEGLYFTEIDKDRLKELFKTAIENGDDHICIKCSDEDVYLDMYEYLLKDQNIFKYLKKGVKTVSYAENTEYYYLLFWL